MCSLFASCIFIWTNKDDDEVSLSHIQIARYNTITPLHALYARLINFSSTCRDFPLNLVKDRLVTWLLQSGMDYLLISDFHLLSTPPNAVWKFTCSSSSSTPLPCCPASDWQRLWYSIITELAWSVLNARIINNNNNIIIYHLDLLRRHSSNKCKKTVVYTRVNGALHIEDCKNYKTVITHQHIA